MPLVLGGMNVVGDDLEGDDMEGELHTVGRGRGRRRGPISVPTPSWMNATTSQGVRRPQEDLDFLSFPSVTIAAAGTTGTLSSAPQRPFRGERLILVATNITAGTDASLTATINPAIFVGAVMVGAAQGATPYQAFRADAFGVRLSWPAAGQGTTVTIPTVLTTVAPAGGVSISGTCFGRAMR